MKTGHAWHLGVRDLLIMSGSRQQQRSHLKRPVWIIVLISVVSLFLIAAYVYPSRSLAACYLFSSRGCSTFEQSLSAPSRELTDAENIALVVIKELLKKPPVQSKNPKIAFMFLTPGALPLEKLWENFFQVAWGKISMLDAEKRLLAHALLDPDNEQFILLSDSCVPLHNFDYVYNYLMYTNVSHIDCFEDPGPHGSGRYSEHMMPEVEKKDFRKGAQWFSMKRQHAIVVMADSLYYTKFKLYCKPNMDGRNCYADEHYLPTIFNMMDPSGIANWSVTHVDWSEGKWHPKAHRAQDVTFELLKNIASIDESLHVTSNEKKKVTVQPCMWNGIKRPCYLFARKFYPETLDRLLYLFRNYTAV